MGKTVSQLSSEYSITRATIYKWIKEYSLTQDGEISKKEFERMKKELNELRMENEILKKATALFIKKQQKNL
jgi:transposase